MRSLYCCLASPNLLFIGNAASSIAAAASHQHGGQKMVIRRMDSSATGIYVLANGLFVAGVGALIALLM
jgi:hypothetical protein